VNLLLAAGLSIAAAGFSISSSTAADPYVYLAREADDSAVFLAADTIAGSNDIRTVWLVNINGDYLHGRTSEFAYYLLQLSIHCQTQRYRPSAMSIYSSNGSLLTSDRAGGEEGPIEPGTIEQSAFEIACLQRNQDRPIVDAETPLQLAELFRRRFLEETTPR
jgi:hypothetical protein